MDLTIIFDCFTDLPHWFRAAYIARCARRFVHEYKNDHAEPEWQRLLASQAVEISETRIAIGGDSDSIGDGFVATNGQFFDNYDIVATDSALGACVNAAENTYSDLCDDPEAGLCARRILVALVLARLALKSAFATELLDDEEALGTLQQCLQFVTAADEKSIALLKSDIALLKSFSVQHKMSDLDPVPVSVFGSVI